jgi:hypothetical protein
MALTSRTTIVANSDVISGILNWVCPECGGRMGGRGEEFKCQGECLADWRLIWERMLSDKHNAPSKSRSDRFSGKRMDARGSSQSLADLVTRSGSGR